MFSDFFKDFEFEDAKKKNIFNSGEANPSFINQLLQVFTSLDAFYNSGVFKKVEATLYDQDVLDRSSSPLPSVQLTGMLNCNAFPLTYVYRLALFCLRLKSVVGSV